MGSITYKPDKKCLKTILERPIHCVTLAREKLLSQTFFNQDQNEETVIKFKQIQTKRDYNKFCLEYLRKKKNKKKLIKLLRKQCPITGQTYLHTLEKPYDVTKCIQIGAFPCDLTTKLGDSPLHAMIKRGNIEAALTLLKKQPKTNCLTNDKWKSTPLRDALLVYKAHPQNIELVKMLVKAESIHTHSNMYTITKLVIKSHDSTLFNLMCKKLPYLYKNYKAQWRTLAIVHENWFALQQRTNPHKEIPCEQNERNAWVRSILENYRTQNGQTILMFAVCQSRKCVTKVLSFNPDINAVNTQGNTALHIAICVRSPYYKELLAAGADITIRNNENKTPINLAEELQNPNLPELYAALVKQNAHDNQEGKRTT